MLQIFVSLMCIYRSLEGCNGLMLGPLFIGPISTDDTGNEEGICIPCSVMCQALQSHSLSNVAFCLYKGN